MQAAVGQNRALEPIIDPAYIWLGYSDPRKLNVVTMETCLHLGDIQGRMRRSSAYCKLLPRRLSSQSSGRWSIVPKAARAGIDGVFLL
ncbi:hypothetical protein WAI453_012405 [Rhynchosporium graminicola]